MVNWSIIESAEKGRSFLKHPCESPRRKRGALCYKDSLQGTTAHVLYGTRHSLRSTLSALSSHIPDMGTKQETREYGFSSPTFSWSEYTKYRPAYPAALYDLIFEYHREHRGGLHSAHDVGSGAGIVAAVLSSHFEKVHVSDPSAHNLAQARSMLGDMKTECEFSFSQTPAEERVLPDATVDMVTIFEALHWTDAPKAMASAAASLKPGGTLALLHYTPRVFVPNSPRAYASWNKLMDAYSRNIYEASGELMDGRRAYPQGDSGLDYVVLSPDVFENGAKRIYINTAGRGPRPFAKSQTAVDEGWFPVLDSQVGKDDVVEKRQDQDDWGRSVDGEWFKSYFETIQPTPDVSRLRDEFAELRAAVDAEPGKLTQICWSVALVLATKR